MITIEVTFTRIARSHSDRKSTRLNSSHGYISYAVFCLKKKKIRSTTKRSLDEKELTLFAWSHDTTALICLLLYRVRDLLRHEVADLECAVGTRILSRTT